MKIKIYKNNNENKIISNNIIPWIFLKISLDILYLFGTSIFYEYLGRTLDFNILKYIIGWCVYFVFIFFISNIRIERIRFMVKCIFLLSGVANISMFSLRNYPFYYFFIVVLFWTVLIALSISVAYIKQLKVLKKNESLNAISFSYKDDFLLVIGFLIVIYMVEKYGLNVTSFINIYSARSYFRSENVSTIDNYLLSWNGTVILPWCFLIAFKEEKYPKAFISLILAFIMFLINGLKTWLVMYAVVAVFLVLLHKKNDYDYAIRNVINGLSIIVIISVIIFRKTGNYVLAALIDRTIILPGEINYYYIDFFSDNEFLYLRESIFKVFAKSPYSPKSSIQISQTYMSAAEYHNATNGLVGDIYGNFGMLGIIIYPFIIIIAFILLNYMLSSFDKEVSCVVIFILMWLLVNTSFFTWLMTGGYFLYIVILWFYRKYRLYISYKFKT